MTRDSTKPFNGEEQAEKTLTSDPLKLYPGVEQEFVPSSTKPGICRGPRTSTRPAGRT